MFSEGNKGNKETETFNAKKIRHQTERGLFPTSKRGGKQRKQAYDHAQVPDSSRRCVPQPLHAGYTDANHCGFFLFSVYNVTQGVFLIKHPELSLV